MPDDEKTSAQQDGGHLEPSRQSQTPDSVRHAVVCPPALKVRCSPTEQQRNMELLAHSQEADLSQPTSPPACEYTPCLVQTRRRVVMVAIQWCQLRGHAHSSLNAMSKLRRPSASEHSQRRRRSTLSLVASSTNTAPAQPYTWQDVGKTEDPTLLSVLSSGCRLVCAKGEILKFVREHSFSRKVKNRHLIMMMTKMC